MAVSSLIIDISGLDELIQLLRAEGRTVLGPRVSNGVIAHHEIERAAELPTGWTEEQEGGTYRLVPTGDERVFAFSSPSESWRKFLFPPRTLLVRAVRDDSGVRVEQPEVDSQPIAFFGIRSCDLAALDVTDRVFLDPDAVDPTYAARRREVFIVAAGCSDPAPTCFCAAMDTGPTPRAGFDLSVSELNDGEGHEFLVRAGSDAGAAVLARLTGRPAGADDTARADAVHDQAVTVMTRTIDPADPVAAAAHTEHPRWRDVAERCLACGNCTLVCPTCFCSTTTDTTDLGGTTAERWRHWDSCFTLDHSYMHGGSVRTSTESRYRQWLLHKLVTWHDQFDVSGCVGCGRCITWCPVGIDLTVEIAALAKSPDEFALTQEDQS